VRGPARLLWAAAVLLALGLAPAAAESLWTPGFRGYLSGGRGLVKGDTVLVSVDASSALSFSASTSDSKNLTLEFSGGEAGNLFSFLPQVRSGGNSTTKGAQEMRLRGEVAAVVTDTDATGRGMIQGTRTISIEGKEESVTVSGWLHPKDLDQGGKAPFSRLGDGKLVFRTFLQPSRDILTDQDIQRIITAAPAAPAAAPAAPGAAAPAAPGTAAQPAATPAAPTSTLALTDARKKELLLLYLNRLVDILFSK
jgi:hypothetical protein